MAGAILLGVCPLLLLGFSVVHGQGEQMMGMSGLTFGTLLIGGGFLAYWVKAAVGKAGWVAAALSALKPLPKRPEAINEGQAKSI
jgi:hypothetical protein